MTRKIVYPIENNQIIQTLPPNFSSKTQVTVYLDDQIDLKSQKLDELKMVVKDPLFLADIQEIHADFNSIGDETL